MLVVYVGIVSGNVLSPVWSVDQSANVGSSISINGNSIIVGGRTVANGLSGIVEVRWEGPVGELQSYAPLTIKGDVLGSVNGDVITCGNVGGNLTCDVVSCGSVAGRVTADVVNRR